MVRSVELVTDPELCHKLLVPHVHLYAEDDEVRVEAHIAIGALDVVPPSTFSWLIRRPGRYDRFMGRTWEDKVNRQVEDARRICVAYERQPGSTGAKAVVDAIANRPRPTGPDPGRRTQ